MRHSIAGAWCAAVSHEQAIIEMNSRLLYCTYLINDSRDTIINYVASDHHILYPATPGIVDPTIIPPITQLHK